MPHTGKAAKVFTFERADVYITPQNEKIVEWRLNRCFQFEGSAQLLFYIEVSETGAGEWSRLNPDNPVIDMCLFVDEDVYRCGVTNPIFYRVIAFDGVREYASKPAHTLGEMSKRDLLLAREIIRKEYLRLKKTSAGTIGYLLKKRWCGNPCSECTDFDTGEPVASTCSNCFGTGIYKGYYNAIPFFMDLSGVVSRLDVKAPFALENNKQRNGRAVAYPRLDEFDIWVHGSANRRYMIRQVATGAEMRSVPLVYFPINLRLLPATDIAYQIPLEQPCEPAVPDTQASPCEGWRKGIAHEEVW